jgi:hypothetical protein
LPLSLASLLLVACALLRADDLTWDNDFSRGLRGWTLGRNAKLQREAGVLFIRLDGPMDNGIADCKSPNLALDGTAHEYGLTCSYRTDVEQSGLHSGAWFIFYILDGDEKQVGDWTGLPLAPAAAWTTAKTIVKIPAGAKTFQAGIRVQGRPGKTLDVQKVTLKRVQ